MIAPNGYTENKAQAIEKQEHSRPTLLNSLAVIHVMWWEGGHGPYGRKGEEHWEGAHGIGVFGFCLRCSLFFLVVFFLFLMLFYAAAVIVIFLCNLMHGHVSYISCVLFLCALFFLTSVFHISCGFLFICFGFSLFEFIGWGIHGQTTKFTQSPQVQWAQDEQGER